MDTSSSFSIPLPFPLPFPIPVFFCCALIHAHSRFSSSDCHCIATKIRTSSLCSPKYSIASTILASIKSVSVSVHAQARPFIGELNLGLNEPIAASRSLMGTFASMSIAPVTICAYATSFNAECLHTISKRHKRSCWKVYTFFAHPRGCGSRLAPSTYVGFVLVHFSAAACIPFFTSSSTKSIVMHFSEDRRCWRWYRLQRSCAVFVGGGRWCSVRHVVSVRPPSMTSMRAKDVSAETDIISVKPLLLPSSSPSWPLRSSRIQRAILHRSPWCWWLSLVLVSSLPIFVSEGNFSRDWLLPAHWRKNCRTNRRGSLYNQWDWELWHAQGTFCTACVHSSSRACSVSVSNQIPGYTTSIWGSQWKLSELWGQANFQAQVSEVSLWPLLTIWWFAIVVRTPGCRRGQSCRCDGPRARVQ